MMNIVKIYTDGSCHSELKVGAWASIIFIGDQKVDLKGTVSDTSHNRMEILAVLEAFNYLENKNTHFDKVELFSDSQYVVDITIRKERLKRNDFITKKGTPIQNADLVQRLIQVIENYPVEFIKVAAHQKQTEEINYNREVDKMARKLVREAVKK